MESCRLPRIEGLRGGRESYRQMLSVPGFSRSSFIPQFGLAVQCGFYRYSAVLHRKIIPIIYNLG